MNILMVALFDVRSCGPTEVLKKIIPELKKLGNQVNIFSPYEYKKEKEMLAYKLGIKYYYSDKKFINSKIIKESIPDIDIYDVVHFHGIYEYKNWMIAWSVNKIGIPYIYTLHGNLMKHAMEKSKIKKKAAICLFIRKILKNARYIQALSENEAFDIRKISAAKIICIPNGIDPDTIAVCKKKNSGNDRVVKFLFIGRIDITHKGIDLLVDAVQSLPDTYQKKCSLVLAGPIEKEKDKQFILSIKNKNINYVGPKYDTEKKILMKECDFFVHTSRYEGMPMAVLEALSLGIPCMITKETNMEDIVNKANAGLVCNCSKDDIVKTLKRAIDYPDAFSVDRDWISRHLLWEKIALSYEKMYIYSKK